MAEERAQPPGAPLPLSETEASETPSPHGVSSAVYGSLSIVLAVAAKQLELLRQPSSGHALRLAEKLGLLRTPKPLEEPAISNTTWVTITDGWCISALGVLGMYFAVLAVGFSFWAEHREEDSLYLGVGFICASMALFLLYPVVGLLVAVIGAVLILAMRRRSGS